MSGAIATVDIGTNTTLLLVVERAGPAAGGEPRVLAEAAEITRLGRGIGTDGRLGRDAIDRTLAVLRSFAATAQQHGAPLYAVGTEALRRADNRADFLAPAAAILGAPVEVITGEREAQLTFLAASRSFPEVAAGDIIVVDIGGGSTEIILAHGGAIDFRISVPLGSVRLTETHIRHDPPEQAEVNAVFRNVAEELAAVPLSPAPGGTAPPTLIGTAGTVTSLAAMAQSLSSYDATLVHGYRLSVADLASQIEQLRHASQAQREAMAGLDPRRADVILSGACVLLEIARRAGVEHVLVNDRGIRWGLAYERL